MSDESDYSCGRNSSDHAIEKAAELGLVPVFPEGNQLQVDLDTEEQFEHFQKQRLMLMRNMAHGLRIHPSKSGLPHRHVTLTLAVSVTPWQRLALQASLGDDPKRAMLNCLRLVNGDETPSVLFELNPATGGITL